MDYNISIITYIISFTNKKNKYLLSFTKALVEIYKVTNFSIKRYNIY